MRTDELAIMRTDETGIDRYLRQPLPTLRDIVAVPFRQRWPMLTAFGVVIVAVVVSGLWVPTYEAQMKILVRRQRSDAIVTSSANAPTQYSSDQVSEEDLNSEVELLNSEDLLRKVVLATGLSGKPGSPGDRASDVRIAKAVQQLGKDLKIEPLRKTNVISVRYRAHNPELAEGVLKALAAAYTEKHLEVHRSTGEYKFFDQQTEQYQQGLNEAQAKLTDFSKGTGIVSADLERDSALRQADEFDTTAHQAQAAIHETEQRVHALQAQLGSIKPRMTTVVRTSDNPQLLQQLKSTLLNLELKKTELLTKYEPTYRLVQEVDQQIADARSAISAEESKPIREESSDQDPNYQWVRSELTKAQADLSGLKARAASAASIAGQYRGSAQRLGQNGLVQQDLLRAAKTQEDNYLLYVHKREEARISDALDQRGILNVALAQQPVVPALPNRTPLNVALLTLLLAGTFSLSTAFVIDFMDPTFRTPDELAGYLGAPVLAALPKGGD
jgi:uncharacterized protein involved in exopolysaccharide biosynthesis